MGTAIRPDEELEEEEEEEAREEGRDGLHVAMLPYGGVAGECSTLMVLTQPPSPAG